MSDFKWTPENFSSFDNCEDPPVSDCICADKSECCDKLAEMMGDDAQGQPWQGMYESAKAEVQQLKALLGSIRDSIDPATMTAWECTQCLQTNDGWLPSCGRCGLGRGMVITKKEPDGL